MFCCCKILIDVFKKNVNLKVEKAQVSPMPSLVSEVSFYLQPLQLSVAMMLGGRW